MDIVMFISLIMSFAALIVAFLLEGGVLGSLWQPTAAMIVFGGTIGVVCTSFPASSLAKLPKLIGKAFFSKKENREEIMNSILTLANIARKDGLLALEQEISSNNYDKFILNGVRLVIDGVDTEGLKHTLETRIENMEERHHKGIAIFEGAGGYAPTMGVIGTVMGLINVLGNMGEAEELGEKIGVAFIATLYGVGSANLLWLPLATKLKQLSAEEVVTKYMMLEGVMMLQNGSNPVFIKEQLKGYLEHEPKEETGERE